MARILVTTLLVMFIFGCRSQTERPKLTPAVERPGFAPAKIREPFPHDRATAAVPPEVKGSPFLDGKLNAQYHGQRTGLKGQVLLVKPTRQGYPLYKLNLGLNNVDPIWVTSIGPAPVGGITQGNIMVFKGFIALAKELDPTGELEAIIQSPALLVAVLSERLR